MKQLIFRPTIHSSMNALTPAHSFALVFAKKFHPLKRSSSRPSVNATEQFPCWKVTSMRLRWQNYSLTLSWTFVRQTSLLE